MSSKKGKDKDLKKKWKLESSLNELLDFSDMKGRPKILLEQYATSAHLASHVLFTIQNSFGELEDHVVLDLGCGPGRLGLGASLLGARFVLGVDIYAPALQVALKNKAHLGLENVDFIQADVLALVGSGVLPLGVPPAARKSSKRSKKEGQQTTRVDSKNEADVASGSIQQDFNSLSLENATTPSSSTTNLEITSSSSSSSSQESETLARCKGIFDVAIMNPPFGTKQKGVDMLFLRQAIQLVNKAVYSFHKTSTRNYIEKTALSLGLKAQVLAELVFDLPKMYKTHRKESVDVRVDFWRFEIPPNYHYPN